MENYMVIDKDGVQTPISEISDKKLRRMTFKVKNSLSKSLHLLFNVLDEYQRRGLEHNKLFAEGKAEAIIMYSFVRAWSIYHGKDLKKEERGKKEEEE